jgi:Domain of unknown function (DUF1707)
VRTEALTRGRGRSAVRASDAERELAGESLRIHAAAGRLTHEELEERIERAYRAQSRGELAALLTDLPSDRGSRGARRLYRWQHEALKMHATTFLAVNGGLTAVWAATGEGVYWPAVILVPTSLLLAGHASASRMLRRAVEGRRRD